MNISRVEDTRPVRELVVASCWARDPTAHGTGEDAGGGQTLTFEEPFPYPPISSDLPQIRLLILHPSIRFQDAITCELHSVDLRTKPTYQALSYAWGDPTLTRTILLNGRLKAITNSAERALRHLRLRDKIRVLWIDAIAINQEDNAERSHQVQMMAQIYQNAQRVLIWLGEDVSAGGLLPAPRESMTAYEIFSYMALISSVPYEDLVTRSHLIDPGKWASSFNQFLRRPWFTRLWVLQEISLGGPKAPDPEGRYGAFPEPERDFPELICGHWSQPWPVFWTAIPHVPRTMHVPVLMAHVMEFVFKPISTMSTCWNMCMEISLGANEDGKWPITVADRLAYLLLLFEGRFATANPRDRLFGILGLLGDPEEVSREAALRPDYDKSVEAVFIDLANYLLQKRRCLDILCGHGDDPKEHEGLPSWVPTWSRQSMERTFRKCLPSLDDEPSPAFQRAEFQITGGGRVLLVKGVCLGSVCVAGTDSGKPSEVSSEAGGSWMKNLFRIWEQEILDSPWNAERIPRKGMTTKWKSLLFYPSEEPDILEEGLIYDLLMGHQSPQDVEGWEEIGDLLLQQQEVFQRGKIFHFSDRSPFVLSTGLMGITDSMEPVGIDDVVCLLSGSPVPFLLRPTAGGYLFRGACVISDLMDDTAQKRFIELGAEQDFRLI